MPVISFKTQKEVKQELKNNCFYIYLPKGENKLRIFDIKTEKGKTKVKIAANKWWTKEPSYYWIECSLSELTQQ